MTPARSPLASPHAVDPERPPGEARRELDALVVLGCRVGPSGELRGASLRRVERAAAAFAEGKAPLVLLSGGKRWGALAEAEAMRAGLLERGVPEASIALELVSLTTLENARYSASLLARRGASTIGLITCDWHLPRARRLFARHGLSIVDVPAPSPPADRFSSAYRFARELVAGLIDATH